MELLNQFAIQKNATPAQIALAWLLDQKPWIVPIPGTTKLNPLEENISAVNIELSPDELIEIDTITNEIKIQGTRYPEGAQKMVNRLGNVLIINFTTPMTI